MRKMMALAAISSLSMMVAACGETQPKADEAEAAAVEEVAPAEGAADAMAAPEAAAEDGAAEGAAAEGAAEAADDDRAGGTDKK